MFPNLTIGQAKSIFIIVLLIVIAGLLMPWNCNSSPGKDTSRGTADSTLYWKNKYHQQVASQKATAEQFAALDRYTRHWLDSLAKAYQTKPGKVISAVTAKITGKTSLTPVTPESEVVWDSWDLENPDTTRTPLPSTPLAMEDSFANRFYTAKVRLGQGRYIRLENWDSLTLVWKDVKEGSLFKRRHYVQVDLSLLNPDNRIEGIHSYQRLVRPKEYSVTLGTDILYLNQTLHPMVGVGIQRDVGRVQMSVMGGKDLSTDNAVQNVKFAPWYGRASLVVKLIKF